MSFLLPVRQPRIEMTKSAPFDEQVNNYDAWFEKHPDLYRAELEAVRSFIPTSGCGVEIGVGSGRFAAPLCIPIGVEPAPRMAELSQQRRIKVLEGVAKALPFADASFDFAVMVTVGNCRSHGVTPAMGFIGVCGRPKASPAVARAVAVVQLRIYRLPGGHECHIPFSLSKMT
jgi:hypothetical protein